MADYPIDAPLRLDLAARIAFPDGSIGPKGLRKERYAGRLVTFIVARKEYTTLAAIERMKELCRVQPKPSAAKGLATARGNIRPDGLSHEEYGKTAQEALMRKLSKRIGNSSLGSSKGNRSAPKT
ncbi:MAG: excisionase [Rhizobiaceae bacterium]|nr:excisionase [Rhizobiaceae bacterium]